MVRFYLFRPENAREGDVIVLTKPLGTQVAVNLNQWRYKDSSWETVADIITKDEGIYIYSKLFSLE